MRRLAPCWQRAAQHTCPPHPPARSPCARALATCRPHRRRIAPLAAALAVSIRCRPYFPVYFDRTPTQRWPPPDSRECTPDRLSYGCLFEPLNSCTFDSGSRTICSESVLFESSSDCSTNEIKQQTFHLLPKLLRLKPHIRRLVDERQRALGLPSRYVAFQIRGGDKPGTEAVYMPPRAFLDGAMEALGGAEHASAFDTAFVMTDDFAMIEGVRDAVPGWRVATMAHEESHMAGKTGVGFDLWRETQLDGFVQFWAESELAASASAVVGSLSSNVGRWVKAMRHASAHRIEFHSVDPKDGIQALRNADVAAGAHACSEPSRRSSFAACSAPWYGVVVDVRAASPVRAGRLGAIGDDVLDLIDALSVLLAADVPFRLASNCSAPLTIGSRIGRAPSAPTARRARRRESWRRAPFATRQLRPRASHTSTRSWGCDGGCPRATRSTCSGRAWRCRSRHLHWATAT